MLNVLKISKKKRLAIERTDAERERKRREDEENKREIEWRNSHKELLKYSTAEGIMYRRERYFLSEHWFDLAAEFFEVVDEDQDELVTWRDTVEFLNDDAFSEYSLALGINSLTPP